MSKTTKNNSNQKKQIKLKTLYPNKNCNNNKMSNTDSAQKKKNATPNGFVKIVPYTSNLFNLASENRFGGKCKVFSASLTAKLKNKKFAKKLYNQFGLNISPDEDAIRVRGNRKIERHFKKKYPELVIKHKIIKHHWVEVNDYVLENSKNSIICWYPKKLYYDCKSISDVEKATINGVYFESSHFDFIINALMDILTLGGEQNKRLFQALENNTFKNIEKCVKALEKKYDWYTNKKYKKKMLKKYKYDLILLTNLLQMMNLRENKFSKPGASIHFEFCEVINLCKSQKL
jgi:hypothetical protein